MKNYITSSTTISLLFQASGDLPDPPNPENRNTTLLLPVLAVAAWELS